MLRDAVGHTCEVKTAQETGESGGISRNHWEIGGKFGEIRGKFGKKLLNFRGIRGKFGEGEFRGKLGGDSGEIGRKLVNCVSPMVKQNAQTVKSISPTSGKTGKNEGKLFHKNSPQGNLCERGGGNEREMKGNFVFTTSFNCTVLYVLGMNLQNILQHAMLTRADSKLNLDPRLKKIRCCEN